MPFRQKSRSLLERIKHSKSDEPSEKADIDTYEESIAGEEQSKPSILATDTSGSSLWRKAWEDLKREVKEESGRDLAPELHLDTLNLQDEVGQVLEKSQTQAKDAEDNAKKLPGTQHHTFRKVYGRIAHWAKEFQFIGDIAVQADPGYATLPWALVRLFITAAVGEDETYHTMLDGTALVSELMVQYPVIERTYAQIDSKLSDALVKTLLRFYIAILKFQIRSIKYFEQGHKIKRTFTGLNPVTAEDIKQERANIDAARKRVDQDIALVHYDATHRGIEDLKEGQGGVLAGLLKLTESTNSQFNDADARQQERYEAIIKMWEHPLDDLMLRLDDERQRKELRDMRKWLSLAEPEKNHEDAKAKRQMPLGDWLFRQKVFAGWENSSKSSILWLYGFAGTGKTGLVRRVIDHMRSKIVHNHQGKVGFFYCSNDKASTNRRESYSRADPEEVLRSIVSQLAISQRNKSGVPILKEKYITFGPGSDQHRGMNYTDCAEVLSAVSKDTPITIVLDAFDECDQDESPVLIKHLKDLVYRSPENVHIFISTRTFPAIEREITPEQSIEVTAENNGDDVSTFIKETLGARIQQGDLLNGNVPSQLKEDIENVLTSRAHNMFLYASLLLNRLCDRNRHDDEASIRKKLEELPKNLTDVYSGIMEEIHDNENNSERSCRIAQDTFRWLLLQEPLTCNFLVKAISPPEHKANIDEVIRVCRTLVNHNVSKMEFEFAHYSVREHISKMAVYSPSHCHIVATKSCLRSLNSSESQRDESSGSQQSLYQYARLHWPLHYEGIKRDDVGEHRAIINNLLRNFLLQRGKKSAREVREDYEPYAVWLKEAQEQAKQSRGKNHLASKLNDLHSSPPSPLFAACVFGLEDIIGKFGRESDGLNRGNSHGQTALCLAIENQKFGVVQALLSRRFPAEVNFLNVRAVQQFEDFDATKPPEIILYASALQCAAAVGNLEIAEFLIDKGAHIDLVAGYYGSPLQAAALKGHQNIVSLLLNKGAEPNSQGGYYGNALQAAARAGQSNIVTLLLENKPPALVNTPGGRYGCALMAAIYSGSSDTVLELLEEGADPNSKSKNRRKPLEEAASLGRTKKEIVSHLLSNNAEAGLQPKAKRVHILHHAAMYNMIDLAEYCLDIGHKIDGFKIDMVTTEGPNYPQRFGDFPSEMTPLAYACAEGHMEMVDLLLRRGAPFENDKKNSAVLWTAAYHGHASVVSLLIERFKAKDSSKDELVRWFEQRPSPHSGHPIMFAAASSGNAEVVRILVEQGAKYELNSFGGTPLFATARFACPNVTKLLLEYGKENTIDVRINQRNQVGRTALFLACLYNRPNVTRLLLKAGADYCIGGAAGATPLHVASHQDTSHVVRILFDKASENPETFHNFINARHGSGRPALMEAAERGRLSNVNLLLERGADYTIQENEGNTTLHYAVRSGSIDMVKALLKKVKGDYVDESYRFLDFLNHKNHEGKTALFEAAWKNQESIIALLMEYGADYSNANNNGSTPLHVASHFPYKGVVSILLEKAGTNLTPQQLQDFLNHRNRWGKTALIDAAEMNRPNIISLLLQHGADYSITDNDLFTALHYCVFRNHIASVHRLLEAVSQDRTSDGERFKQFLNQQGKSNGASALHDAALQNLVDMVKLLLSYGAAWDTYNFRKRSPLSVAINWGHTDVAIAIIDHAKKNEGDVVVQGVVKGETCIFWLRGECRFSAEQCNYAHQYRERLRRLLNAREETGENVWDAARKKGDERVLEALRACGVEIEGM